MPEIIQWINDPVNYPLDARWEDLPVELRVPDRGTCVEADARTLEVMAGLKRSDGTALFQTPRDVLVSHVLAFTPRADCWIGRVRVHTMEVLLAADRAMEALRQSLACSDDEPDDSDENLPTDPSEIEPEDASLDEPRIAPDCPHVMDDCECAQNLVGGPDGEPPIFWSDEDKQVNTQEQEELEQEQANEAWEARHPECRTPVRE